MLTQGGDKISMLYSLLAGIVFLYNLHTDVVLAIRLKKNQKNPVILASWPILFYQQFPQHIHSLSYSVLFRLLCHMLMVQLNKHLLNDWLFVWTREGACLGFVHATKISIFNLCFPGGLHLMHSSETMKHSSKQFCFCYWSVYCWIVQAYVETVKGTQLWKKFRPLDICFKKLHC